MATTTGLVTLGETMALVTAAEPGPLRAGSPLRLGVAGAESNVAIGVRRLGQPATWIGRVGTDELGDLILRELRAEGVTALAVRDDAATGLMLKQRRTADLVRVRYYRAGLAGSRLCPDDIDESAVRAAAVLHVTGITPALGTAPAAAVDRAIELARAAGVPVSVDVNYRAQLWAPELAGPVLRRLVSRADIVFAGGAEAGLLVRGASPAELVRELAALGPTECVLKLGPAGAYALIDGAAYTAPGLPVTVVDPVGAGDAFVAGYLADLMAGAPPPGRLATGNAAGAFAVGVPGDWEGLPSRAELALLSGDDVVR